jgi:UDP-N-acetylglucosamine 4,6-dehydratase/5-epimerase
MTHKIDFTRNALGEHGEPVADGFAYSSDRNTRFLAVEELSGLNGQVVP